MLATHIKSEFNSFSKFDAVTNEMKEHDTGYRRSFISFSKFDAVTNEIKEHDTDYRRRFNSLASLMIKFDAVTNEIKEHETGYRRSFNSFSKFDAVTYEMKEHDTDYSRSLTASASLMLKFDAVTNEMKEHDTDYSRSLPPLASLMLLQSEFNSFSKFDAVTNEMKEHDTGYRRRRESASAARYFRSHAKEERGRERQHLRLPTYNSQFHHFDDDRMHTTHRGGTLRQVSDAVSDLTPGIRSHVCLKRSKVGDEDALIRDAYA
ncbi:hypothetical protein J6590_068988 [Homalodisca vitripennis]|nr:hypothetical protein J6590_068988 [Homalodisca vitripennis]